MKHLQLFIDFGQKRIWFVALHNASAHTTPAIEICALEHQRRLELVYLPTLLPYLNRIEHLWLLMRSKVSRNRFYESSNAVAEAAVHWLDTLPFAQFCYLIGIDEWEPHLFTNLLP